MDLDVLLCNNEYDFIISVHLSIQISVLFQYYKDMKSLKDQPWLSLTDIMFYMFMDRREILGQILLYIVRQEISFSLCKNICVSGI